PYRRMVWGLPAIFLLALIAAAAGWGYFAGGVVAARYVTAVEDARKAGDYNRMELFERKLAQLGVDTRRTDYESALALAEAGQLEAAYQRMLQLAPADRLGYSPARMWIIERLLSGEVQASPEEKHR